jgi:hypothetical protein
VGAGGSHQERLKKERLDFLEEAGEGVMVNVGC